MSQSSDFFGVIIRPILTERSTIVKEKYNQYAFQTALGADKRQIKAAVESLFKVKVEKVQTMVILGKFRRMGRSEGYRADWKKAIVKIAKGQKIELAEQAV